MPTLESTLGLVRDVGYDHIIGCGAFMLTESPFFDPTVENDDNGNDHIFCKQDEDMTEPTAVGVDTG